jgi:DNA-binding transcriptional ArsR family regulator
MQSVEFGGPNDDDIVRFMACLSEPKRYSIVRLLASSSTDMSCGAIGTSIGLSPSLVSHHLSALESAGVLERRRNGLWTLNRLRRDVVERHIATLSRLVS